MKVTKVCCQGCGADLPVDESIRFATCNHCHARLEIVHDPTVTHTRLLEHIGRNTEEMAGNLRVIELQNDLERLDREWDRRRERFMVTGKNGHRSIPTQAGSLILGGIMVFMGIVVMSMTSQMGGPGPLFGLVFIGVAIFSAISGMSKSTSHQNAKNAFTRQRNDLIRQIERARQR